MEGQYQSRKLGKQTRPDQLLPGLSSDHVQKSKPTSPTASAMAAGRCCGLLIRRHGGRGHARTELRMQSGVRVLFLCWMFCRMSSISPTPKPKLTNALADHPLPGCQLCTQAPRPIEQDLACAPSSRARGGTVCQLARTCRLIPSIFSHLESAAGTCLTCCSLPGASATKRIAGKQHGWPRRCRGCHCTCVPSSVRPSSSAQRPPLQRTFRVGKQA